MVKQRKLKLYPRLIDGKSGENKMLVVLSHGTIFPGTFFVSLSTLKFVIIYHCIANENDAMLNRYLHREVAGISYN